MKAFSGRVNRATYWAQICLFSFLYAIFSALLKQGVHLQEVVLAFVCVPRLHDIEKSGWAFLAGAAVELIGAIASVTVLPVDNQYVGLGITTIFVTCLVVWLGIIPGEAEPNRFGAAPPSGVAIKII
jgi:uncharacterized membrane protein YhaH (DUF805 family)